MVHHFAKSSPANEREVTRKKELAFLRKSASIRGKSPVFHRYNPFQLNGLVLPFTFAGGFIVPCIGFSYDILRLYKYRIYNVMYTAYFMHFSIVILS